MSRYSEQFNLAYRQTDGLKIPPEALSASYPALAAALAGIPTADGKGMDVPPIKILIWCEAARIEASLLTWKGGTKAFITLPDALPWEQSLEDLLASGNVPWKKG